MAAGWLLLSSPGAGPWQLAPLDQACYTPPAGQQTPTRDFQFQPTSAKRRSTRLDVSCSTPRPTTRVGVTITRRTSLHTAGSNLCIGVWDSQFNLATLLSMQHRGRLREAGVLVIK